MEELNLLKKYIAIKEQGFFYNQGGQKIDAPKVCLVARDGKFSIQREPNVYDYQFGLDEVYTEKQIPPQPYAIDGQLTVDDYGSVGCGKGDPLFFKVNDTIYPAVLDKNIKTWRALHE